MRKSILLLVALLTSGFVLTACGSQDTDDMTDDVTITDDTTITPDTDDDMDSEEIEENYSDDMAEDDTTTTETMTYTLEEVAQHSTPDDCWTVIEGQVADVTSFFGTHPGGDDNLAKACGIDATDIFESVRKHDPKGYEAVKSFMIGTLQ